MESSERLKRLATITMAMEMLMGDAKGSFMADIESAEDGEFKEFLKENFDEITGVKKNDKT